MPFHFYRALRNESLLSPPLGSAAGGTLVSIELDDTMASDATFLEKVDWFFKSLDAHHLYAIGALYTLIHMWPHP